MGKFVLAKDKVLKGLKNNALLISTIFGVILAVVLGLVLRPVGMSRDMMHVLGFPGELFLRMLKMLIIPLVICSIVSGISQLSVKTCGIFGIRTLIYYLCTTILAVITGISFVYIVQPGVSDIASNVDTPGQKANTLYSIMDLFRNLFPNNVIQATIQQVRSVQTNNTNGYVLENVAASNVLGIIMFCIVFGIILCVMKEEGKILVDFFTCLNVAIMKLVQLIMIVSPVGICSLILKKILFIDNLNEMFEKLGMYMICVLSALSFHGLITLPMIYLIFTKKNPFVYIKGLMQALLTAFGTSSSAATLAVTFKCVENNNNVDSRISKFVLPIGATVNMDGTALYEAIAALFIAQLNKVPMSFGNILMISMTATLASISAASIPSAGLVTLLLVLQSVGLPTEDVGLLFTIDWLLDRFRTVVNVVGDALGAGIIQHQSQHELVKLDRRKTIILNVESISLVKIDKLNDEPINIESQNT